LQGHGVGLFDDAIVQVAVGRLVSDASTAATMMCGKAWPAAPIR
jgi:hypothetical protein